MSWPPHWKPSITSGSRFARPVESAAVTPAGPPPMMMTFRTSLSLTLPPPPVVFWTYSVCNGPAETRIPGVSVGTPGHDTAMDAITLDTVRSLAEFRAQRGCALSLYLDLDPSTTPT